MPTLHLLGTGAALSGPQRTTTMLAFTDAGATLVVDCGGDVVQRLLAAGIDLATLAGLIVTHEHPDHVGGFPLFVEKIWLAGRKAPLPIYGIAPALDQARRCFETFNTSTWDLPELVWHEVAHEEDALVLEDETWRITAAPVVHAVPNIGLRVESLTSGGVVTYSSDTEPTETVVRLGRAADVLVHEASGPYPGHTAAADAARIAARAAARRLVLVHLPADLQDEDLDAARTHFDAVSWGDELGAYPF